MIDLSILAMLSMVFIYFMIHVIIRELSFYYRSILELIGIPLSLIVDVLSLCPYGTMLFMMLGLYMVLIAITLNCFRVWYRYLILLKLLMIINIVLILIPTSVIYLALVLKNWNDIVSSMRSL